MAAICAWGPLPEFVHARHVVTAGGQELWIERASRPLTGEDSALRQAISACRDLRIIRDDDAFNAAVVDVGRVGITYAMVMEARSSFGLAQFVEELPWARVSSALRRGRDRVRDVTWEEIGSASNVTAMTGSSDTLYAATSRNALWARAAIDGDAQWHFVGPAEDIRAMTLAGTRLFAVTNSGLLLHRPVSGRASGWTRLGRADGVQALTAVGRWLYGTNNRSRLLRRSTVLRDERVWVDCGHANEIVSLA